MLLEPIRMVADWLEYGTNTSAAAADGPSSVNALLTGVPRDAGDAAPSNVTIYDETRHDWVARLTAAYEGSGIAFPALAVFAGDVTADGEVLTTIRDGHADVTVMFLTQGQQSAATATAALYTMRAVMRSLKQLSAQLNGGALYDTVCRRNAIALRGCQSMRVVHPNVVKNGIVLHSGVTATYSIRDESP